MNKPIFQKIKRSQLESINQSPYSQQKIVTMSVNEMQRTMINQMNHSHEQKPKKSDKQQQQIRYNRLGDSSYGKSNPGGYNKVPELMFENDQLKNQIEKLKNQKQLILSKYEEIDSYNRQKHNYLAAQKQQQKDEFSFKKSVQQIDKLVSLPPYKKAIRQNSFNKNQSSTSRIQKNIPSSDSNKGLTHMQSKKRTSNSLQARQMFKLPLGQSSKQQFSTLQQRFYQYYKTQMVRMNTQNTKLTLKICELQNKLTTIYKQNQFMEQQNIRVKNINQSLEEKLISQSQRINKINDELTLSLNKKDQIISNEFQMLSTQVNELKSQEEKLRKTLLQKESQIINLQGQNTRRQKQTKNYGQLVRKNAELQNQLTECMIRNKRLSDKFRRMPIIDHLWEIKEVQYQNLIDLIQKQNTANRSQLQNSQLLLGDKNKRTSFSNNVFDLTFSKEKRHF